MPLPKSVKIGPAVYALRENPSLADQGLLGVTKHIPQVIEIRPDQGVTSKRDTVFHESIHAVCEVSGMAHLIGVDDEGEERIIRLLTPWLLGLLRDNPRFVAYLLEK